MKNISKLNILIVEDEQDIMESMVKAMCSFFKEIITAQHGDEAIKKFKKYNPDIVITDISMPIMDGLDMTKEIKKISPQTPVIALSAFSDKDKLLKAIEVGVDKYLLKPIDMDELIFSIETIAKNKIDSLNIVEIANGYEFDYSKKTLIKNNKIIPLTKKELSFIILLINNSGNLVLLENIKDVVWGNGYVSEAAIRTFVKRVRDKIGSEMIKNISGLGYKISMK